jgi:hypothetical protein
MARTKRAGSKRFGQDARRQDGEGKDDSGHGTILTGRYSSV